MARSAEGGLVSFFRFPREGGDPDPFTQFVIIDLDPRLRGERGGEGGDHPHPPLRTLSATRGKALSITASLRA